MEALLKYEQEDDKLYKAWKCMAEGSVLLPDGYTSNQVLRQETDYLLRTWDDQVELMSLTDGSSYVKLVQRVRMGARFSMPVRLAPRGFMGSMSITPWKPLFMRALWRCRGLVREVSTTPDRSDLVENGTYTEISDIERFLRNANDIFAVGFR